MSTLSHIRRSGLVFLCAMLGIHIATGASATSLINGYWNDQYDPGISVSCNYCHADPSFPLSTAVVDVPEDWDFTPYGVSLRDEGLRAADGRADSIAAFLEVEPDYAPVFDRASEDLDDVPSGTSQLTLIFDAAANDDGGSSAAQIESISWSTTGDIPASLPNSSSGIVDISALTPGTYNLDVTAVNDRDYTTEETITFTITNNAPVVTDNPTFSDDDTSASFTVDLDDLVSDADGDPLTFDRTSVTFDTSVDGVDPEDTASISGATLTFLPSLLDDALFEGESVDIEVTYTVSDGFEDDTGTVTLTVDGTGRRFADLDAIDDDFTTPEDTTLTGENVLDNDTLDGLSASDLTITFDTSDIGADEGVFTELDDGAFTFAPAEDFFGSVAFSYTIEEDGGTPQTATATIEVTEVNDPPVVVDPPVEEYFTTEVEVIRDLLAASTVTDVDSTTLQVRDFEVTFLNPPPSVANVPVQDVVQRNGATMTITPPALDAMDETERTNVVVTYSVDDTEADPVPVTIEFAILGVEPEARRLRAQPDTFTIDEDDGAIIGEVLADNGAGPDGLDGLSPGDITVAFDADGIGAAGIFSALDGDRFQFRPAPDFNGEVSFDYTISDGQTTARSTVTITVRPVNDPPAVLAILLDALEITDAPVTQDLLDPAFVSDPDADDTLTATDITLDITKPDSVADVADSLIVGFAGSQATIDPTVLDGMAPGDVTDVRISYLVDDGSGTPAVTNTLQVAIVASTDGLRLLRATDDAFTIEEDATLAGANVLDDNGNGIDDLDGLSRDDVAVLFDVPSDGTLTRGDAPGSFSYTPPTDFAGTATIPYTLVSGASRSSATVSITVAGVNDAVALAPISLGSRTESDPVFSWNLLLRDNAPETPLEDPDGDTLTATVTNVSVGFVPAGLDPFGFFEDELVQVNGSVITFTPRTLDDLDIDEVADVTIDYVVSDGNGGDVTNTLSVRFLGLDNSVIAQPGAYADTLASRYTSQPFGAHFRTQEVNPGSCLTCHQPESVNVNINDCTSDIFNTFGLALCNRRIDGRGPLSDLVRRLREVEPDFAPRLEGQTFFSISEGTARGASVGSVQATDPGRDIQGNESEIVTWLFATRGARPTETDADGNFAVSAKGEITVIADDLPPGTYELGMVPVNDARQRDNDGQVVAGARGFFLTELPRANVIVEVTADSPFAVADDANTEAGAAVEIDVIANDLGGAPTRVAIAQGAENGAATVNADNTITYTPAEGFTGVDKFIYETSNAISSAPSQGVVTVNVIGSGDLVARDDTAQAVRGASVVIDVLANDANAILSGDGLTNVEIETAPDESAATLRVVGQSIEFTPGDAAADEVSFTYRASNAGGSGSSATVTVAVVSFAEGVIADAVRDPELARVATVVDRSCAIIADQDGRSAEAEALLNHCTTLGVAALSGEQLDGAMRAIRNEEHLAVVDMTSSIARGMGGVVSDRISRIRTGGARGFDLSGVSVTMDGQSIPSDLLAQLANGVLGARMSSQERERYTTLEWGMFLGGDFSLNRRDGDDRSSDYDFDVANVVFGVDYKRDPFTTFGLALGFSNGETEFGDGSTIDAVGYQATLYAVQNSWNRPGLSYEGYVSFGRTEYDSDRKIAYDLSSGSVDTAAQAEFDGQYANAAARVNYSQIFGSDENAVSDPIAGLILTYYASLDYLWFRTDDYTERNGDGLALSVESEIYRSLIADVGVDFRRPIFLSSRFASELYGGVAIGGELLDEERSVTSSLAAVGSGAPSFTVTEDGAQGLRGSVEIGLMTSSPYGDFDVSYGYAQDVNGFEGHDVRLQFSRSLIGQDRFNLSLGRDLAQPSRMDASVDYRLDF
ncbi:MAG: Ig-like domain-containing protein [Pseudomonadota bacterium]